jgi:glutamyl-tRNA synthetase
MDVLEQEGMGMGKVMQSLRVSITGEGNGPDLMDIIEILGKKEITERIELALRSLKDKE